MQRITGLTLAAALAVTLTACSADSPPADPADPPTQGAPAEGDDNNGNTASSSRVLEPCGGITPAELESIFGITFRDANRTSGSVDDGNIYYTVTGCSFDGDDAPDAEVDIRLAYAEDFDDGELLCVPPSDAVYETAPVDGVGSEAHFQWREFAVDEDADVKAKLVVCTDEALVHLDFELPPDFRATLEQQAFDLAKAVVG